MFELQQVRLPQSICVNLCVLAVPVDVQSSIASSSERGCTDIGKPTHKRDCRVWGRQSQLRNAAEMWGNADSAPPP